MVKARVLLLISAIIIVAILFTLPRVVVENDSEEIISASTARTDTTTAAHNKKLTSEQRVIADKLLQNLYSSENVEKSTIFADSLAELYVSVNQYDSAAKFIEIIAQKTPTVGNMLRAANAYYDAYGYAMDDVKRNQLAGKSREYFQKVLLEDSTNLTVKNKLAMTYITSSNPMQGIMMLREILKTDPKNMDALFNLGLLSMQSGQYDKAVDRFRSVVELYPDNSEAQFYLGVSYLETSNKGKAKEQFLLVKSMDKDPAIQATIDAYLDDIE